MPTDLINPNVFTHVRMVLGMVVSLALARLLIGLVRFVQHPGRLNPYWVHLLWAFSMMLTLVHFWWWEFELARDVAISFDIYLFVIFYAVLFFVLCALLFPDDLSDYQGYRDYFLSRRGWFFGILALTFVLDGVDTLVKGKAYFGSFGLEYPLRLAVYVALCIAAAITRSGRFHAAFAVGNVVYQASWIVRNYEFIR